MSNISSSKDIQLEVSGDLTGHLLGTTGGRLRRFVYVVSMRRFLATMRRKLHAATAT